MIKTYDLTIEQLIEILNDKSLDICPYCGNIVEKNDNYCGCCGNKLNFKKGNKNENEQF